MKVLAFDGQKRTRRKTADGFSPIHFAPVIELARLVGSRVRVCSAVAQQFDVCRIVHVNFLFTFLAELREGVPNAQLKSEIVFLQNHLLYVMRFHEMSLSMCC